MMDLEATRDGVLDTPILIDGLADGLADLLGIALPGREAYLYGPFGPSYMRYGSRGRMAIHVWPERRVATVDVWMDMDDLLADGGEMMQWLQREHQLEVLDYRVTDVDPG
jgi:hypothetical protein